MRKLILTVMSSLTTIYGFSQYKYNNVLFKTVFPQDLCETSQHNNGYILLDVHFKGGV